MTKIFHSREAEKVHQHHEKATTDYIIKTLYQSVMPPKTLQQSVDNFTKRAYFHTC